MWHVSSVDAGGEEAGADPYTLDVRKTERRGGRMLRRTRMNIFQATLRNHVRVGSCRATKENKKSFIYMNILH